MDVTSINKAMTESKQTKTKTFVFVVALKRAVLNGSTKSRFEIFVNFTYCFFFVSFLFYLAIDRGHGVCEVLKITAVESQSLEP